MISIAGIVAILAIVVIIIVAGAAMSSDRIEQWDISGLILPVNLQEVEG